MRRNVDRLIGKLFAFASGVAIAALAWPALAAAPAKMVVMHQMEFDPAEVVVEPGETVEWKNEDIFAHTVTANDGSFDSGLISPGSSWQMKFEKIGTLGYHCRPHPNMTAQVVVREGATEGTKNERGSLAWSPPRGPQQLHPILVNFTAALLPMAFLSDILGRVFRRAALHVAGFWITLYAAVMTPFTAAAGWWWSRTISDVPARLIVVHQWLGTAAVPLFIGLAIWRWRVYKRELPPGGAYLVCALVVLIALVYQGSLGGEMAFGH